MVLELGSSSVSKRATRGCSQGSVLGPACWNLKFDDLLRSLESSIGNNHIPVGIFSNFPGGQSGALACTRESTSQWFPVDALPRSR